MNQEQKAILKALNTLSEPAGCKVIGEAANMSWRSVMSKIRGLKKEGYVESLKKGKYIITEKGKDQL